MPGGEYQDWIRYYNAEPWGFPREDMRAAELVVAVLSASSKKFQNRFLSIKQWMYKPRQKMDVKSVVDNIRGSFPKRKRGAHRQRKIKNER